jgi:Flp pilus assembly pilin Flp
MTDRWKVEFTKPRGPKNVPAVGTPAPDFELPYARVVHDEAGNAQVEYGRTLRLSALRGQTVALNLSRIVSDRFF